MRWDRIKKQSELIIATTVSLRNQGKKPSGAVIFVWALNPIMGDNGVPIKDLVMLAVPPNKSLHQAENDLAKKVHPLATLILRDEKEGVRAKLHSIFGEVSWDLPAKRKGDRLVVEAPSLESHTE